MTPKETAKKIIDSLPEEATIDDVMHALYVHAKFEHGLQEGREGRFVNHEEAVKRLQKWVK